MFIFKIPTANLKQEKWVLIRQPTLPLFSVPCFRITRYLWISDDLSPSKQQFSSQPKLTNSTCSKKVILQRFTLDTHGFDSDNSNDLNPVCLDPECLDSVTNGSTF
jgi:hypothetical protein